MLGYIYIPEGKWFVGVAIPYSECKMQCSCQQMWTHPEQNKVPGSKFSLAALWCYGQQKLKDSEVAVFASACSKYTQPKNPGPSYIGLLMYKWPPVNPRGNCSRSVKQGQQLGLSVTEKPTLNLSRMAGDFFRPAHRREDGPQHSQPEGVRSILEARHKGPLG